MGSRDRPISCVLKDIFGNVQEIIRSEVRLAKAELREELGRTQHVAVWLGIGGVSAFFALAFLLSSIFFALLYIVPHWAAALLMAIALAVLCAMTFRVGAGHLRKMRQIRSSASATLVKESGVWTKHQAK